MFSFDRFMQHRFYRRLSLAISVRGYPVALFSWIMKYPILYFIRFGFYPLTQLFLIYLVNALCIYREIDLAEFKKVMGLMQAHNRQGAHHSDGRRAGHSLGGHVENGGLLEYLFGEDGKQRLQHDRFVQFLRDLHDEVWPFAPSPKTVPNCVVLFML